MSQGCDRAGVHTGKTALGAAEDDGKDGGRQAADRRGTQQGGLHFDGGRTRGNRGGKGAEQEPTNDKGMGAPRVPAGGNLSNWEGPTRRDPGKGRGWKGQLIWDIPSVK